MNPIFQYSIIREYLSRPKCPSCGIRNPMGKTTTGLIKCKKCGCQYNHTTPKGYRKQ